MEPRYSFLNFPTDHPQSFQIAERNPAFGLPVWGEPDVILAIGCRLIREYRYLPEPVIKPDTRCIHIEEDPWEIGKVFPVDLGIIADSKSALRGFARGLCQSRRFMPDRDERLATIKKAKEQVNAELEARVKQGWDGKPISAARLARTMDRFLEKDTLVVNESPTSKDIIMANFNFSRDDRISRILRAASGLGTRRRDRRPARRAEPSVVACLGDGSTMFGLQGLWTLAKYRVPLIVIVFNNRAYMAVKNQFRGSDERIRMAAEMGAELVGPEINFARLARPSASLASGSNSRTPSSRRLSALRAKRTGAIRCRNQAEHQKGLIFRVQWNCRGDPMWSPRGGRTRRSAPTMAHRHCLLIGTKGD